VVWVAGGLWAAGLILALATRVQPAAPEAGPPRRGEQAPGWAALGLLAALMLVNGIDIALNPERIRPVSSGRAAPDFELPTPAGDTLSLADLRGRVLLVSFWASWCGPCLKEMPLLQRMQAELGGRGLTVLAINIEGNPRLVHRMVAERGWRGIRMLVDDGRVAGRFGVQALPHLLLVDRAGQVRYVQSGAGKEARLQSRVAELLRGGPAPARAP
jgi:thiol-disulfide isomerase/thioredoxin